jgi:hypothetical protein
VNLQSTIGNLRRFRAVSGSTFCHWDTRASVVNRASDFEIARSRAWVCNLKCRYAAP